MSSQQQSMKQWLQREIPQKKISESAKELKERGVNIDTATKVEEITVGAGEIGETVKHTTRQVGWSAPLTGEALRDAATKATRKLVHIDDK